MLRDLRRVRRLVITDTGVCGGAPVFRGTRVPIHLIAELVEHGSKRAELIESYPRLTAEMIRLAPLCAAAYPPRGPKRKLPWHDQQPVHQARRRLRGPAFNTGPVSAATSARGRPRTQRRIATAAASLRL